MATEYMCMYDLCFEQKEEQYHNFSSENYHFIFYSREKSQLHTCMRVFVMKCQRHHVWNLYSTIRVFLERPWYNQVVYIALLS